MCYENNFSKYIRQERTSYSPVIQILPKQTIFSLSIGKHTTVFQAEITKDKLNGNTIVMYPGIDLVEDTLSRFYQGEDEITVHVFCFCWGLLRLIHLEKKLRQIPIPESRFKIVMQPMHLKTAEKEVATCLAVLNKSNLRKYRNALEWIANQ